MNNEYPFDMEDEYNGPDDDEEFEQDPLDDDDYEFADPGGRSALRAASASNPRIHPCPNCGAEDVLTPRDVSLGYQCDSCADRAEGRIGNWDY